MKSNSVTQNVVKSTQVETDEVYDDTLGQAIKGDLEAFGLLYQENIQRIYNYIYYRTGNSADAEDITARVFQRALKHIQFYKKTEVPFSAWLYRIAHNLVANWHRDNSRRNEVPLDDQEFIFQKLDHPEISIVNNQQVELLLNVIHLLSSDRQLIIILKFVEDLSNIEIAQIMDKSEGAVKSLYHRTLLELRDLINKRNL
jgi:RNA polymerase sigma-70 factor (ECF subfamily)